MMTTRVATMIPTNQTTTGFRMNRLRRARTKPNTLRRGRTAFSISTKVEGEGNNPYWLRILFMFSVNPFSSATMLGILGMSACLHLE